MSAASYTRLIKYSLVAAIGLGSQGAVGQSANQIEEEIRAQIKNSLANSFGDNLSPTYQLVMADPIEVNSLDDGEGENWEMIIPIERISFEGLPMPAAFTFEPITGELTVDGDLWDIRYQYPEIIALEVFQQGEWVPAGYQLEIARHESEGVFHNEHKVWQEVSYRADNIELVQAGDIPFPVEADINFTVDEIIYEATAEEQGEEGLYNSMGAFVLSDWLLLIEVETPEGPGLFDFRIDELRGEAVAGNFFTQQLQYFSGREFRELAQVIEQNSQNPQQLLAVIEDPLGQLIEAFSDFQMLELAYELSGINLILTGPDDFVEVGLDEAVLELITNDWQEEAAGASLSLRYNDLTWDFDENAARNIGERQIANLQLVPHNFEFSLRADRVPSDVFEGLTLAGLAQSPEMTMLTWLQEAGSKLETQESRLILERFSTESQVAETEFTGQLTYDPQANFSVVGSLNAEISGFENIMAAMEEAGLPQQQIMGVQMLQQAGNKGLFGSSYSYDLEVTRDSITLNGDQIPF